MNRSLTSAAIALALVFGPGCGYSPEGVCKNIGKLADEAKMPADKDGGPNCAKRFETIKKEDPKQYECLGACSEKGPYAEMNKCMSQCLPTPVSAKK